MAELDAQVATRPTRRGVGNLFAANQGNVPHLPPMPEKPTLVDYLQAPVRGDFQSLPPKRQSRHEERHVGGDRPGLPVTRHRAGADQGRSRLVECADVRAVRLREGRVRHPIPSGAPLLRGQGAWLRIPGSLSAHLWLRLPSGAVHPAVPIDMVRKHNGTSSRAW